MLWYPSIPSVCLGMLWFLLECFGFAYHTPKGLSLCTSLSIALLWYVHTLLAYLSIALLSFPLFRHPSPAFGISGFASVYLDLLGSLGMFWYLSVSIGTFPSLGLRCSTSFLPRYAPVSLGMLRYYFLSPLLFSRLLLFSECLGMVWG